MSVSSLDWRGRLWFAALCLLVGMALAPDLLAACGTSCQCGPGERCDVSGECEKADKVTSPAAHPLCCTDPDCSPQWLVCEHLDGAIGTCGASGCTPHGCLAVGKECGVIADGYGSNVDCGICSGGDECVDGMCDDGCVPNCQGKSCGEDGCGGICGECQPGSTCSLSGFCELCAADCLNKECGDDGCGGTCGGCPPGMGCDNTFVCTLCEPNCLGKECGDNGCGGSCGICPGTLTCSPDGLCLDCLPDCLNKECGNDGCGGVCGTCGFTEVCTPSGICGCAADCLNKECGDDGCGGSCGSCGLVAECGTNGMCVPEGTSDVVVEGPEVVSPVVDIVATADGAADVGTEEVQTADGVPINCPSGTHPVWDTCVKDEEESGSSGGGCATSGAPVDGSALTLMFLALALLYGGRRQWGGTS